MFYYYSSLEHYVNNIPDDYSVIEHTFKDPSLVVTGVYEGGAVEWECESFLANFLFDNAEHLKLMTPKLSLFILGSGKATAALTLIKLREARGLFTKVVLQDLNVESFESLQKKNSDLTKLHCVVCDWSQLWNTLKDNSTSDKFKFDLLLSSETLYRVENFDLLANCFEIIKKVHEDTIILIASKRFYFGLGGGSHPFRLFCKQNKPHLKLDIVHTLENNMNNILDILKLSAD